MSVTTSISTQRFSHKPTQEEKKNLYFEVKTIEVEQLYHHVINGGAFNNIYDLKGTFMFKGKGIKTETTTIVSTKNRVYIDGPAGATIYFDDTYLGVAPLDFAMVTGSHTFIVISGTTIKSYAVNLVEGADDVRYDFTPKSNN